ncbi:TerD family protein [Nocardia huaxiensis]|uniref:TerD family protein n=1 Tax=Nocardia huaxiensis TaxID=2755382 RepID=A0A7D6ZV06_9NOCA|nr:TerD family protein [Nocardia huaxiensis]QLY29409.1 TerD family protein [Nocardia huaxiensis]UFS97109.1 TerD family protein [Nocardia huaxiensis]
MTFPLRDAQGADIVYLSVGLGWDPARRKRFGKQYEIDLNVAAMIYSGTDLVDVVYHEQMLSTDQAVRLHGDNLTGEGPGDDEIITVDLTRIESYVTAVLFVVTCYTGQDLAGVENAFCRMVNTATAAELARYDIASVPGTGFIMGGLFRPTGSWEFREINQGIQAQHPVEATAHLGRYL